MTAALYGLVLAGGHSTRMGQDKAALAYHGASQLDWAMALVTPYVERAFISVRTDQSNDPIRARYWQIVDEHEGLGPIAGILAAQARQPDVAWLVLACDLPFIESRTLACLISNRAATRMATAFRSSHDGLPEPLCTIYEPSSRAPIAAHVASGKRCPRKFLLHADVELLDLPEPQALDNINTPAELGDARSRLSPATSQGRKSLTIQYYALLRDQAGRREESLATDAETPRQLYSELKQRYRFTLDEGALRVAINAEFRSWDQQLNAGDTVVFIPPVAGG